MHMEISNELCEKPDTSHKAKGRVPAMNHRLLTSILMICGLLSARTRLTKRFVFLLLGSSSKASLPLYPVLAPDSEAETDLP